MISKAVLLAEPARPTQAWPQESFSLMPVANRPLVCHALRDLAAIGITDVCLVAAAGDADAMNRALSGEDLGTLTVLQVTADPNAGLTSILRSAERFIGDDPFVLHFGDSLSRRGLSVIPSSLAHGMPDILMLVQVGDEPRGGNVIPMTPGGPLEPAGVTVVGPAAMAAAREIDARGGWERELKDIMVLLGQRGAAGVADVEGWWRHQGRHGDLLEANRFALEGLQVSRFLRDDESQTVHGPAIIDRTAIVEDATIRGPVVIGPGARVRGSYVGPYTAVGADVVIEGAEVEHSVLLDGARVCHLGCRLEGSVVGRGARIARDMRLPRALRLNLPEGADISLA